MTTHIVQKFYNHHPYPHYPLLATPRWQEGYLASSRFARFLTGENHSASRVCIIGCGEMLPAIIRSWEPRSTVVHGLDLSEKSLKRAKFRCLRTTKKTSFECDDFSNEHWYDKQEKWDHIDAFGVLHHLKNPHQGLIALQQTLAPGGTLRLMVYNSIARWWIHAIQRHFQEKKLSPFSKKDITTAKKSLMQLRFSSLDFHNITKNMGSTFHNDARFVDTFMHPQETHLSIAQWHHILKESDLQIVGLFDRYHELDHLTNPLYEPPSLLEINSLAEKGLFHGNLEIYLKKKGHNQTYIPNTQHPKTPPPKNWFSHPETHKIPWHKQWKLWWAWHQNQTKTHNIALLAKQRLTRIGAYHTTTEPHIHEPITQKVQQSTSMKSKEEFYKKILEL